MSRIGTKGMQTRPEGEELDMILTTLWHCHGIKFEEVGELFRVSEKTVARLWQQCKDGELVVKRPEEVGRRFWLDLHDRVGKRLGEVANEPNRTKRLKRPELLINVMCMPEEYRGLVGKRW